jgi:hypothetical protein
MKLLLQSFVLGHVVIFDFYPDHRFAFILRTSALSCDKIPTCIRSAGTGLELREHQRFPVPMSILFGPPNGPAEEGIALNLSLGGCAIRLPRRIAKDLVVLFRMCVPGDAEPIRIETAVTRWFKGQVLR